MATADWSRKTSDVSEGVQRQFWRLIATGVTTAEASLMVDVSAPVGTRWFRHAGGMPPISLAGPTDRYLTFEGPEEIAITRAKDKSVRGVARALGRDPGTISRELRRNAAKLVTNDRLREYVQERFEGRGALKRELVACLRTGRALRQPRARPQNKPHEHVIADVVLSKCPAETAVRAVSGHWEGDLMIGTVIERRSRSTLLVHLPSLEGGTRPLQ